MWTGQYADKIKVAIFTDDWGTIAMCIPQIAQKLSKIEVSANHRLGKPWVGAYSQLTSVGETLEVYEKSPKIVFGDFFVSTSERFPVI